MQVTNLARTLDRLKALGVWVIGTADDGEALTAALYELADRLGGSFSAEHGVGLFKRAHLERFRGGTEIALMRTLKAALDPRGTLNPGKVI